jgi:hypothetical protein
VKQLRSKRLCGELRPTPTPGLLAGRSSVCFDKRSAQIIGVMPEGCQFPFKDASFWLLNTADPRWKGPYWPNWRVPDAFAAVGRLKPQIFLQCKIKNLKWKM